MIRRFMLLVMGLLLAMPTLAHGPSRQKVVKDITINAPPAKVWALIADFCSIAKWHPAIANCVADGGNAVGGKRTLNIGKKDGPQIVEELLLYDIASMTYKYKILKTDNAVLPVTTYASFLAVADNGNGTSKVTWRGGFYRAFPNNNPPSNLSDEAATKAVASVYEQGLANLKKLAEK